MDVKGMAFPAIVAAVSAAGLFWHFSRARKGPITGQDKAMGGAWAAMLVLAAARVLYLVANPPGDLPK